MLSRLRRVGNGVHRVSKGVRWETTGNYLYSWSIKRWGILVEGLTTPSNRNYGEHCKEFYLCPFLNWRWLEICPAHYYHL